MLPTRLSHGILYLAAGLGSGERLATAVFLSLLNYLTFHYRWASISASRFGDLATSFIRNSLLSKDFVRIDGH